MNAHLEFLKRRAGKGDRTSLWVFGSLPHLIQNFIVDDQVYYLQAYDAPWGIATNYSGSDDEGGGGYGCVSIFRFPCYSNDSGGTVLSLALGAVIIQFDEDEKRQKNSPFFKKNAGRSIVIITDAAISDLKDTIKHFEGLRNRNIKPYLIWINESGGAASSEKLNIDLLLATIEKIGGKYFPVTDEAGFTDAYLEIDKLEKTKVEVLKIHYKVPLFQNFILLAILSLLIIIPLGLLVSAVNYP